MAKRAKPTAGASGADGADGADDPESPGWRAWRVEVGTALAYATCSLSGIAECAARGRLPRIGDDAPPWTVRGWLLPYVMDLRPGARWRYWLDHVEAGRLLDEPIPRLDFDAMAPREGQRQLDRAAQLIGSREGFSGCATRLVEWLAWALHVTDDEPRLHPETAEGLYRTLDLAPLVTRPADYLGWLMSEYGSRYDRQASGFFPTPMGLSQLMAQLTFSGDEDARARRVCDPCVGTGALLLAASNHSLRLCGQDINRTCVLACLCQGMLYAPWLARPLPDSIFPPDAPTEPAADRAAAPAMAPGVQLALFDA